MADLLLFVIAVLLAVTKSQQAKPPEGKLILDYCIKYFGSIEGEVWMADAVPKMNFNGSIPCPRDWTLPRTRGATLTFCPPYDNTNGMMMEVVLSYSDNSGLLSRPIDHLRLGSPLITNGTFPGPFEDNAQPATITYLGPAYEPAWTINGTEKSLIPSGPGDGVYLSCKELTDNMWPHHPYCGWRQDRVEGGCWMSQEIDWDMEANLTYSIRFDDVRATVRIWTGAEYYLNKTATGTSTTAYLEFNGSPDLPSVVDYDFWTNADGLVYETEKARLTEFSWAADENHMPVMKNRTTKDVYVAANQTYSGAPGSIGGLRNLSLMFVMIFIGVVAYIE